jgi:hypothetical protein
MTRGNTDVVAFLKSKGGMVSAIPAAAPVPAAAPRSAALAVERAVAKLLHAARTSTASDVYRKGGDYLLRTQLDDGTWFVRTRAFGFQPYFETGFPYGCIQFISTVATSWASMALTYMLE